MFRYVVGPTALSAIIIAALAAWPTPQGDKASWSTPPSDEGDSVAAMRRKIIEIQKKEIAETQEKGNVNFKNRLDQEYSALDDERRERRSAIFNASDEQLRALYRECERKISAEISKNNKPAFAVYFPNYTDYDLDRLSTSATALGFSTGRPSTYLNSEREKFISEQIRMLRELPHKISIVAESASDSFSGVRRWAARFDCDLNGLSIRSVSRVGSRHFFD